YVYCPRKLYFRHVMHLDFNKSYKMQRGSEIHENEIKARPVERAGNIERYYNIHVISPKLGLMAVLDAFEFDGGQVYPVEFKTGTKDIDKLPRDYVLQLVLQALLLEDSFNLFVMKGKFVFTDMKKEIEVPITVADKKEAMHVVANARRVIADEMMPDATQSKGHCMDCEMYGRCMAT
nr:CRISPR-associated protein Cas4 [Candidatus Sigynarchaeota archaeon]